MTTLATRWRTAGDVNGDGYADLVVGALRGDEVDRGKAYVYSRLAGWPEQQRRPGPPRARTPVTTLADRVGTAGDVNGDGYADVIVGAYGTTGDSGAGPTSTTARRPA